MVDSGPSFFDILAVGLAVVAVGEMVAARFFSSRDIVNKLIPSLLLWEGVAMFACAAVVYVRQDVGIPTIIALIAIWMAGAAVGLLRAGIFDTPKE